MAGCISLFRLSQLVSDHIRTVGLAAHTVVLIRFAPPVDEATRLEQPALYDTVQPRQCHEGPFGTTVAGHASKFFHKFKIKIYIIFYYI